MIHNDADCEISRPALDRVVAGPRSAAGARRCVFLLVKVGLWLIVGGNQVRRELVTGNRVGHCRKDAKAGQACCSSVDPAAERPCKSRARLQTMAEFRSGDESTPGNEISGEAEGAALIGNWWGGGELVRGGGAVGQWG